jgi:hypothetical protein
MPADTPILYYFPGSIKDPFGHVAMGGIAKSRTVPEGYLSYGEGTGSAASEMELKDGIQYRPTLEAEKKRYGEAFAIPLSTCDEKKLTDAISQFSQLQRANYNILTNNCANACIGFMKSIGFIPQEEETPRPLRPQALAERTARMILSGIQQQREVIKASSEPPLKKIVDLIRNDIDRLTQQLQYDEIAHFVFSLPSIKKNKIQQLNTLLIQGEAVLRDKTTDNVDTFHASLQSTMNLGSKTAANILECINIFPKNLLSVERRKQLEEEKIGNVDYFKQERKYILTDDEMDPTEKLRQLLQNDINRLAAQQIQDKKTTWGRFFKNADAKTGKVNNLQNVLEFLKEPADYPSCLDLLVELTSNKAMKNKTQDHLKQCIDCFPRDKLSTDNMRNVLQQMDSLLQSAEGQGKFNNPAMSAGLNELQKIIYKNPGEDLNTLDHNTVFERYLNTIQFLKEKTAADVKPADKPLQDFYKDLDQLTIKTMTTTVVNAHITEETIALRASRS